MSLDEPEYDLLAAFQQRFGLGEKHENAPSETNVLKGAEHIYNNAIDVSVDMYSTKSAAESIWHMMQQKEYSTKNWSNHELHPKAKTESTVDFIFTMDLLNFSFWSDKASTAGYAVDYKSHMWIGYWGLVAALQRALNENIPITSSDFWQNEEECTEEVLRHVFRTVSINEEIPLFDKRVMCLREAGRILYERFDCKFTHCIKQADKSAVKLVNLLVDAFPSFRDEAWYEDEKVRFLKRAQILVADLWACFQGQGFGEFHDIDKITIFADYRIPQMLHSLGCLSYSPPLDSRIRQRLPIESGHSWEVQLRGCSIWAVELIIREIKRSHPKAEVNAILIDFFLFDTLKERAEEIEEQIPHHRTRSIWY